MIRRVVVVGGGAAGWMAAIHAARRAGADVTVQLIERTRDGGRKILVSGGGRCNVLPSESAPERFVTSSSPNTLRKILLSWPLAEQRAFFEEDLGLPLKLEEESKKLFPVSDDARSVRDALVEAARRAGVEITMRALVTGLEKEGDGWTLRFDSGDPLPADAVILATGGLSVPKTGSDGVGLAIARLLGHRIVDPYPALTPLLTDEEGHHELRGISRTVTMMAGSGKRRSVARGGFLFTHDGYSGPAVLDLSHHAVLDRLVPLRVCWADVDESEWTRRFRGGGAKSVLASLREELPDRLARRLLIESGVDVATACAELPRARRLELVERLVRFPLRVTGNAGYRKAEVTGGGVHLGEVDPSTLESRHHRGLYFCGEILDAFGPIGGHNFAWAWATGKKAGESAV